MRFERMSLVTVFGKSFSAQLLALLVRGYKFGDSRESLSECRNLVAQIDEQIFRLTMVVFAANCHRRYQVCGRVPEQMVWYEAAVAIRPKQSIQLLSIAAAGGKNVYGIVEPIRFLSQTAGK